MPMERFEYHKFHLGCWYYRLKSTSNIGHQISTNCCHKIILMTERFSFNLLAPVLPPKSHKYPLESTVATIPVEALGVLFEGFPSKLKGS